MVKKSFHFSILQHNKLIVNLTYYVIRNLGPVPLRKFRVFFYSIGHFGLIMLKFLLERKPRANLMKIHIKMPAYHVSQQIV